MPQFKTVLVNFTKTLLNFFLSCIFCWYFLDLIFIKTRGMIDNVGWENSHHAREIFPFGFMYEKYTRNVLNMAHLMWYSVFNTEFWNIMKRVFGVSATLKASLVYYLFYYARLFNFMHTVIMSGGKTPINWVYSTCYYIMPSLFYPP